MERIDVCSNCGKDIFEGDKVWYEVKGDGDETAICNNCERERDELRDVYAW